jgi:hypothetical protein
MVGFLLLKTVYILLNHDSVNLVSVKNKIQPITRVTLLQGKTKNRISVKGFCLMVDEISLFYVNGSYICNPSFEHF